MVLIPVSAQLLSSAKAEIYEIRNKNDVRNHIDSYTHNTIWRSFLLQVLTGQFEQMELSSFQKWMFKAGHAHAGVIAILSLIAQVLVDYAGLSKGLEWIVRIGFPASAILISGGFFGGAIGHDVAKPTELIWLLYLGSILLFSCLLLLGLGLIFSSNLGKVLFLVRPPLVTFFSTFSLLLAISPIFFST